MNSYILETMVNFLTFDIFVIILINKHELLFCFVLQIPLNPN
jgi:hypothetical protein